VIDTPAGVLLQGAMFGTGTGLLAVGLVLTYRTTRIINFSYGAMGSLAAGLATGLHLGQGWSWPVCVVVGIAFGVLVGALVERLVVRRFATAPRLVLTVATIGLAQLLGGAAVFIPSLLDAPEIVPGFKTRLSTYELTVDPVLFTGNDLLRLAVAPVLLLALGWFLTRTEAGMAVRGMAENMDRARLLGIPVNRLSLLLWAIAGGLAATTVVLAAPTQGIPFDAGAGPAILLPALAAAVVSGMWSLWRAFLAGIAVGVLDQFVQWNVDRRALTSVVLLAVIVVGLLLRRRDTSRAFASGESSWTVVGTTRPLARRLAVLPEVRVAKAGLGLLVVAAVVALPLVGTDSQVNFGTLTIVYGLAALSLVVLTGWGGVVSLGQVAIFGVGGVVAANLVADRDADLFLVLGAGAVAGGVVALALGLPALRVSGQLLAVTTLAFAVTMDQFWLNPANFPDWLPPSFVRPELWGRADLADERWLYAVALGVLAGGIVVVANLRRARAGRTIAATRDNERAAAAVGVNGMEARLAGFVIAGMMAGVAGALHAITLRGVGNDTYPSSASLLLFSMAVIGGSSSIGGTLAGVVAVQWLGYAFPRAQLVLTGVGLLVILWLVPGGLAQAGARVRDRFAAIVGRRRGVPATEEVPLLDLTGRPEEGVATVDAGPVPGTVGPSPAYAGGHGNGSLPDPRGAAPPLLDCRGVESWYGSMQVLFGVDAAVGRDEVLGLLGTNGAGKSTLLRSVSGLLPARKGTVRLDGVDVTGATPEQIARKGVSLMPGGKGVFPTLTVEENLRLASWMHRRDRTHVREARDEALGLFPILRERWGQHAGDLSGGEQQQLSLAMAFVTRPRLLLIDELSLGLAPSVVSQLVERVHEIHRGGTAVVVVEQSVDVALLLCRRAVFLEKGQVRYQGPTAELLDHPEIVRAVFLGDSAGAELPRSSAVVGTGAGDGAEADEGDGAPPAAPAHRGVALEVVGAVKRFGGIRAVDEVELTVDPGTIVGLIGHNGAGKTTLFDVISGFLPADEGRIVLGGRDITGLPPHRRAVAQLGRSFQEARLYPSLTVAETVAVALETHLTNRDPLAAAVRLPVATYAEWAASRRVDELLDLLGLDVYRDHRTAELSTGTRRIVELACLLAQDPAVVLLDEPSSGVAQRETEALGPLLRRVQAATGCSMLVIEHDMGLISSLCDELVALELGRVIARGTPAQVLQDDRVLASYLGTDPDVHYRSGVSRV